MKQLTGRCSVLTLLAALSFAGCTSLMKPKPAPPAPAPVPAAASKRAPLPDTTAAVRSNTQPLFIIERNKNANVVHYDASFAADGSLNPVEPVISYWVMLAGDGSRKKLNWLKKKKAYGIRVKPGGLPGGYIMTLAAAPWMQLSVKKSGAAARAEVAINGQPAVLEKLFIQAREKLLGPKVEYIELYGKNLQTGAACREKILPR